MPRFYSRRNLFRLAGAAATSMLSSRIALPQQPQNDAAAKPKIMRSFFAGHPDPFPALETRSKVSLVQGDNRRKMIYESLLAIDDQIRPKLKQKKSVVIKPNNVSTNVQLASTHPMFSEASWTTWNRDLKVRSISPNPPRASPWRGLKISNIPR